MKHIIVTTEPIQIVRVLFENSEIVITLRYFPVMSYWTISVVYNDRVVNFRKLSLGTLHMENSNLPFDFYVEAGDGIDPYDLSDFTGRCRLLLLEREDIEAYRGVKLSE